jgi:hypothetical protein
MTARLAYLVLSVLGFLLPYSQLVPWLVEYGPDRLEFTTQMFETRISTFFAFDVLIAAGALLVFILFEGNRLGVKHLWMPILGTLAVGVSFGLPLFLYLRESRLERATTSA